MLNCRFPQNIKKMANTSGAEVTELTDGRYKVKIAGSKGSISETYNTEDEVREFLTKILKRDVPDLDGNLPFAAIGEVAKPTPNRIGDQLVPLSKARELYGAFVTGIGRFITPIEHIAKFLEAQGQGEAYTKVWKTLQDAAVKVNKFFAHEIRPRLGGISYDRAIIDLNKETAKLDKHQSRLAVLVAEALTKQELEVPGALLANGIDNRHKAIASFFEQMGMAEDIPRLLRANVLIDDFLKNRASTINETIPALRRMISEGQIPPEFSGTVDRVSAMVGNEDTLVKVMDAMQIPENEAAGMIALRALMGQRIDDPKLGKLIAGVNIVQQPNYVFNIPAIFRYAIAPNLEPGFKNGWDQFAAKRGMTDQAKLVAKRRWEIIADSFEGSGFDPKQILGGALPVFRQFIDVGMFPGRQYGHTAKGAINTYSRMLVEDLPEAAEVLTRRVLSGHINPFELHPSVTANKHVRNMIQREHLDPKLKGVKEAILTIDSINPDMGRIFGDHFNEVIGLPNESFKRLNDVFRGTARFLGINMDDQMAERLVHMLSKTVSQAAIPLRPALIVRNYLSQSLFTSSYIGPEAWFEGLKIAMGRDTGGAFKWPAMKEAIKKAVDAGAIDPNVLPIHGHVIDFQASQFSNVPLQRIAEFKDRLFDMGFTAYRSGDDFGRTVAFHAARFRANKYKNAFKEGRITYEQFKEKAKVKIHHEVVEAEFDRLVQSDMLEEAIDMLGLELAKKTHFVYGNGNHPVGWGGPFGRLFGQFGTFPTQYAQALVEGVSRGTMKDKAEFIASHSAFNMGIVAVGLEAFDADLTSWAMLPSLTYTGGPYADVLLNLATMLSGNDAEKGLARRSLAFMFPSAENPQSVFVPGSYFLSDWVKAFGEDDILSGALRASGVRTLGPGDRRPRSRLLESLDWIDEIGP